MIVKSLKSPRSAVCKTAIMASADIFKAYNDIVIDSIDPLVCSIPYLLYNLIFLLVSCTKYSNTCLDISFFSLSSCY